VHFLEGTWYLKKVLEPGAFLDTIWQLYTPYCFLIKHLVLHTLMENNWFNESGKTVSMDEWQAQGTGHTEKKYCVFWILPPDSGQTYKIPKWVSAIFVNFPCDNCFIQYCQTECTARHCDSCLLSQLLRRLRSGGSRFEASPGKKLVRLLSQ
jgi:hypothetical protein